MASGLVSRPQQPMSVGNVTQLAAQTQQRANSLHQDVQRLEDAIQQLVQQTQNINQNLGSRAGNQGSSASAGISQPSQYMVMGGNQSDSEELDLDDMHDSYGDLDDVDDHRHDHQDTGSGGANNSDP